MTGKKGKSKGEEKISNKENKQAGHGNHQIEQNNLEEPVTYEPKLLTEDAIYYRNTWDEKPTASVPPPTPTSDFGFEYTFKPLPDELPSAANLKLPLVREKGVKICIELMAEYFGCKDYNFSLFQFWFLDVITDCLWKAQDEFGFPDHLQKVILEWILYIFDVIRGGNNSKNNLESIILLPFVYRSWHKLIQKESKPAVQRGYSTSSRSSRRGMS